MWIFSACDTTIWVSILQVHVNHHGLHSSSSPPHFPALWFCTATLHMIMQPTFIGIFYQCWHLKDKLLLKDSRVTFHVPHPEWGRSLSAAGLNISQWGNWDPVRQELLVTLVLSMFYVENWQDFFFFIISWIVKFSPLNKYCILHLQVYIKQPIFFNFFIPPQNTNYRCLLVHIFKKQE